MTLCCCLPLGIVSIVYASKINSLQNAGDYEGAKAAAKKAKIFMIVGAVGGLIASVGLLQQDILVIPRRFRRLKTCWTKMQIQQIREMM